jgi:aspartyl-tRNA(Asn)/glutamyl-tRNA(Gln) amidotransferase subunit A
LCADKAHAQAKAIDKLPGDEKRRKPLCGVPVAIKDNICYRGHPVTCGSKMLAEFIPPYDATVVGRLIDAGAVIIGKTNLDEFAMGSSNETSHFGPVLNPHSNRHVPGGSSGGSAAAVAAGMVPLALGSDTGGSVRQPSAFCGVHGLKPTYGLVSRYGLVAFGSSLDQIGPIARDPHDLDLAMKVIAGHDELDSTTVDPDQAWGAKDEKTPLTFGLVREFLPDDLHDDIRSVVERTVKRLRADDHRVVDISLPLASKAVAAYYIIANSEASSNLARYDGVRYGLRAAGDLALREMYARTRSAGFGAEVKRRIMLGTFALSSGYYDEYYRRASQVRTLLRRELDEAFAGVDLLVGPVTPTPPFELGERFDDPLKMYLADVFTTPASLAGIPALSVPQGKTADGLPLAVQLMGPAFSDSRLLAVAASLNHNATETV